MLISQETELLVTAIFISFRYFRSFEPSGRSDSPKHLQLFAELLPPYRQRTRPGPVHSVLGKGGGEQPMHYSPGAKKIDVISRIMVSICFKTVSS